MSDVQAHSAHLASWADSLPTVRERHPELADMIADALDSDPTTLILSAVVEAARVVQLGKASKLGHSVPRCRPWARRVRAWVFSQRVAT